MNERPAWAVVSVGSVGLVREGMERTGPSVGADEGRMVVAMRPGD